MFKFNFDLSEDELEEGSAHDHVAPTRSHEVAETSSAGAARYREMSLKDLIKLLPDSISFSPIRVPVEGSLPVNILRRDLYDARFQVMNDERNELDGGDVDDDDEKYVDGETDLVPGKYEGGLKTWEGGADLVQVLAEYENTTSGLGEAIKGKRILEVGCGTALPSAYLLRLLSAYTPPTSPSDRKTIFHLQDYNLAVLHLVTLPNLLLAILPASHLNEDSQLDLDDETIDTALRILEEHGIELRFSCGAWSGLQSSLKEGTEAYDLVLTAETIYRQESVDSLIGVLQSAVKATPDAPSAHKPLDFSLDGFVILLAAKVLYFGVGGGLLDFADRLAEHGGRLEEVKSWESGVGRKVVKLAWGSST